MHAQTKKNRVVSKHGRVNTVTRAEETGEQHRFLKDLFSSAIEMSWSWTLLSFCASFYVSWTGFAVVWYLLALRYTTNPERKQIFQIFVLSHGDLNQAKDDDHVNCVDNVESFTSSFLFSLETQHTIGYGGRATSEQCPAAVILMSIQSIVGVIIDVSG